MLRLLPWPQTSEQYEKLKVRGIVERLRKRGIIIEARPRPPKDKQN